jgi:three-Cys-motif partner protein
MAAPTGVLWERDQHTKAKHDMVGRYLDSWFPIIAKTWSSTGATYVDAFAGPGEYSNGGWGSPIIALRAATRADVAEHPTDIRMVFVEKEATRLAHLNDLIDRLGLRGDRTFCTSVHGRCETELLPTLDRVGAWGGPMFVNLDGWGVDTPYTIVERVGRGRSSEVLITFQTQWFTRFATLKDIDAGDVVFGETGWREVDHQPTDAKKRFLVDRYLGRLRDAGFAYTLTFEMVDEGGHELLLVFGTGNSLGVEKMKDAMWAVDKVSGQRFRDPRDVNQLAFEAIDSDPDLTLLRRQLLGRLQTGPATLVALKDFALVETVFKKTHVDPAVRNLEQARTVERVPARRHEDVVVRLAPPRLFGA